MNFKKIVVITIALNMVFAQTAFVSAMPSDVIGESYETAVSTLFDKGIITGDENGKYNPEQTLTRAQACIIVVKSMKPPIAEVAGTATQDALKSGFPDMSGYGWAEGYISYAIKNDYITDSIYKYKRVITPAQYILENNRITSILLPKDVGYTGSIYCVINDTVDGLRTLTAAREINWAVLPGIKNIPSIQNYSDGIVFKLNSLDGKIQSLVPVPDMAYGYTTVEDYKINGPVMISSGGIGKWMQISSTATIYTIDTKDQNKYKVGSTASIKQGLEIKLFDISDDDEMMADIVIIKE